MSVTPPSFAERKTGFKLPPSVTRDKLLSQETRRTKALEEQKRRRAEKFDSSRQLDLFADLNLGPSDDDELSPTKEYSGATGLGAYVSMLDSSTGGDIDPTTIQQDPPIDQGAKRRPKKKRRARHRGDGPAKPSKWADKCMYAELLEMAADDVWDAPDGSTVDGLPDDLETGWLAVAPVPAGKRCLAVTHQSSGVSGVVPNTTLRSRLLGKLLVPRFPTPLPPMTVLDCILDSNWRENGILHILDVVTWKGQDIADCETPFRFWWRDTRLAELAQSPPPSLPLTGIETAPLPKYHFSYPTTFIPIPYHADTTLATLSNYIIPEAQSTRIIEVSVPRSLTQAPPDGSMDIDASQSSIGTAPLATFPASIPADGLLLYVSEASYEAGTSPLSSWIPIVGYTDGHEPVKDQPVPIASGPGPLEACVSAYYEEAEVVWSDGY
ncbi:hypothetical protein BD779DRAFT_1676093 [Infundibulicybe gibba]|nr:hypothetical protein BD779DRAFT_1676093 [Infundibulicybe gibba]